MIEELRARIAELERERDELALRLANTQVAWEDWKVTHSAVRWEVEAQLQRERAERLEAAIRDAPHDFDCSAVIAKMDIEGMILLPKSGSPCDCWKRAALGDK